MRQARERSSQALCSCYHPGGILKDLVSNLFPERKAAFQEDNAAVLVGNNLALKEFFAFEGTSLPIHGAIESHFFL